MPEERNHFSPGSESTTCKMCLYLKKGMLGRFKQCCRDNGQEDPCSGCCWHQKSSLTSAMLLDLELMTTTLHHHSFLRV